jgi:2-polyprenyl-6-methoxyphenol hydroxylase-like FAD-dependent oxidoreductase
MPLRILIVGAGLAGLGTAIGFMRHDHQVTVIERKAKSAEESGSGILLGPNAMRVIEAWGLKVEFEKVAHVNGTTNMRRFDTGQVVKNFKKPKGSLMLAFAIDLMQRLLIRLR